MIRRAPTFAAVLALLWSPADRAAAQDRPSPMRPGIDFQSPDTRDLQADETRNPGMLWVEQGAKLWSQPANGNTGPSCATCHEHAETSMKGIAALYPRVTGDAVTPRVVNLEGQINTCRTTRQGAPALAYESNSLLALTAYLAYQSRGLPRTISDMASPAGQSALAKGDALFRQRQGQLNLACSQCHDGLAGRKLRGDTISQGQSHGWPAYRLEWQSLGSLHRRLRACSLGVRAEVLDYGHPDYLALEVYLAWRGEGLPLESPGVRR